MAERYRLVMNVGPNPGKVYELTMDTMSIGREASNDIVVQDAELSRNHARISRRGGAYVLEDLGSTNGTFINRQRLTAPRNLAPGDEVGFGENVLMTFQGEGAAATVAASGRQAATRQPPPPPPQQQQYAPPPQQAAPARTGKSNKGLIVGCLVLAGLCIVALIGAFIFDYLNLYCTSPFNIFFGMITTCG
ncbi:MAG: FHA domain-containing protein [Anaerolineales bacterium]|nr:FHA domain-containing protein [Anaerolineales bacterium]